MYQLVTVGLLKWSVRGSQIMVTVLQDAVVSTLIYCGCKGMKATITLGHSNVLVAPLPSASKKNSSLKMLLILS